MSGKRGTKRKHKDADADAESSSEEESSKTEAFLEWTKPFQLNSKVCLSTRHCASGLGMWAKEDIAKGERLFRIPDEFVFSPQVSRIRDALGAAGLLSDNDADSESEAGDDDDDSSGDENDSASIQADLSVTEDKDTTAARQRTDLDAKFQDAASVSGSDQDCSDRERDDADDDGSSEEEDDEEEDEDGGRHVQWAPLLLALVAEYTAKKSRWHPYLHRMADSTDIDLPHTWPEDMREDLLLGLGILDLVRSDVDAINWQHAHIALPFIRKHPKLFGSAAESLALYQKLSYFVMANSFTDTRSSRSQTVMVPMADGLNHHCNHNAELEVKDGHFEMCAIRHILKDEEVFNTYGRSGLHDTDLLRLYGFTIGPPLEQKACAAYLPLALCRDACSSLHQVPAKVLKTRWTFLMELGAVEDEPTNSLGMVTLEGGKCSLDDVLAITVKVLAAGAKDKWRDEEVDPALVPSTSRQAALLKWMCEKQLSQFKWSAEECQQLMGDTQARSMECRRYRSAVRCCWEQMAVLRRMIDHCSLLPS